jgi:hypothetical protein
MLFGYLTLATALIISLSAAVYSILGLTAIFAAAFWPIVIMGGSLEFGKIVTTLWLHKYWDRAEIQYKIYLCSAVAILMLLTSMGVFGFLSKAHTDQSLVSGDAGAKVAIYDEKIKTERDNVEVNRKALKQMDEAVDQVMARSTTEGGADKAVAIRRSQQKERQRLLAEINESQKKISVLSEERAPLAAENRKIEAEVGPIKYIAAMVYGDNPDANVLEKAVRWVIILIVVVFDPLALTLLLAATKALEWERGINIFAPKKRDEEMELADPTDDPVTKKYADDILQQGVTNSDSDSAFPLGKMQSLDAVEQQALQQALDEEYPFPQEEKKKSILDSLDSMWASAKRIVNKASVTVTEEESADKKALRAWKESNPDGVLKAERQKLRHGKIDVLPWDDPEFRARVLQDTGLQADNLPNGHTGEVKGFGIQFPSNPGKGDMFLRVDRLPSVLYKFNGSTWIEVDKALSDNYAYDDAYIDHLISKISTGEYDPDLLSDAERNSIEEKLRQEQIK